LIDFIKKDLYKNVSISVTGLDLKEPRFEIDEVIGENDSFLKEIRFKVKLK
jgi:hypothetical protein